LAGSEGIGQRDPRSGEQQPPFGLSVPASLRVAEVVAGKRGEAAAYKLIGERVAAGERAYVVCPKVEDDGEAEWKDATTVASELAAALPQVRVGLVHGRLDGASRDRVMRAFKAGELDALVARIAAREVDPYAAADQLLQRIKAR